VFIVSWHTELLADFQDMVIYLKKMQAQCLSL